MKYTVKDLAEKIQGLVIGNEDIEITGITNIANPADGHITFAEKRRSLQEIEATSTAAVIVPRDINESSKTIIQHENPKLAYALLLPLFFKPPVFPCLISEKAAVATSAKIGSNVT
ncbi:MAG: hypothetical protein EOM23_10980, partial [Candidatus Moranbacteria bacterium]|nr:hypothetical protein [Candidatus Moranbacteria bacterium]